MNPEFDDETAAQFRAANLVINLAKQTNLPPDVVIDSVESAAAESIRGLNQLVNATDGSNPVDEVIENLRNL